MGVDITIKGLPSSVAQTLRERATAHECSVEEEVVGILEAALANERHLTINDLLAKVQATGLHTPSESVAILREDRDASPPGSVSSNRKGHAADSIGVELTPLPSP